VTAPAPRLAADAVVRRFGARVVLDAAYVDLVPGLVTALVGVSGSGKTTLLEILVGRLRPHGGQVRWDGTRVPRPTHAALARRADDLRARPGMAQHARAGGPAPRARRPHAWRRLASRGPSEWH
jgi:ABC-type transporter Mla maintaining outer membrane lipid asymmetry ATPase subunit MlaF